MGKKSHEVKDRTCINCKVTFTVTSQQLKDHFKVCTKRK